MTQWVQPNLSVIGGGSLTLPSQTLLSGYTGSTFIATKAAFTPAQGTQTLTVITTYNSYGTDGSNSTNPDWGTWNNGTGMMTLTQSGTFCIVVEGFLGGQSETGYIYFGVSVNGASTAPRDFRIVASAGTAFLDFHHSFITTQLSGTTLSIRTASKNTTLTGLVTGLGATMVIRMTKIV